MVYMQTPPAAISSGSMPSTYRRWPNHFTSRILRIRGKCSTVSAQTMINRGLLDLHSVFRQACEGEDSSQWVQPVHTVRDTIRAAAKNPLASLELLDKAFKIAFEFGEDWQLSIAVHLLALLPHSLELRQVYERLWTRLRPTSKQASETM